MKTERTKQGISLIVLVLTIIVIIILAATVIISLTNNGIIGKANEAVNEMDLKQAQTIAQAIWADVYLDNLKEPGKYDLKLEVIRRLAEQQITEDKYSINVTDKGVEISLVTSDDWITIYSGTANSQEGVQLIANYNLFASKAKYKITFELDGVTREVETIATSVETEYAEYTYGLFGIDNTGKVIGIEKEEDIANMGSLNIEIMGMAMYSSTENQTVIAIMGTESTFSIKKIETQGMLIYEGNITIEEVNEPYELEGIGLNNSYLINATIGGVNYYAVTVQIDLLGTKALAISIDGNSIVLLDGVIGAMTLDKTVQINKIYDIGDNEIVINSENGFVVTDEGYLIETPDTAYTIPQTVNGITVTKIYMDRLSGTPTIAHDVDFDLYDFQNWSVKKIVITDSSILKSIDDFGCYNGLELIDATACTKLEYIPERIAGDTKVLVDGVVKANNYDNTDFICKYMDDNFVATEEGILCYTPLNSYTIPQSVAGKQITGVYFDLIQGEPTFDRDISIKYFGSVDYRISKVTFTISDLTAFESLITENSYSGEIRLEDCSEVVIPGSWLESNVQINHYCDFMITEDGYLCYTPSNTYTIPQSVAGTEVTGVYLNSITGTPIFDRVIEISYFGNGCYTEATEITITISDVSAFEGLVTECGYSGTIDLSQCGSDVVIPESWLSSSCFIYVDSTAKETLYSENSNVESR